MEVQESNLSILSDSGRENDGLSEQEPETSYKNIFTKLAKSNH